MPSKFDIVAEPEFDLIRITMSGFFEPADIASFKAARDEAHQGLRSKPNQHLTLVDMTSLLIQSQETVEGFRQLLMNPAFASKRIAIVVSQTLARMQIERAAAGRDVSFFVDDVAAARSWILTG